MEAVIENVRLMFSVNNIIDVSVANNILYLAVEPRTVLSIDLNEPAHVEDTQLPKSTEGVLRKLFVHPKGNHVIALTSHNEHFFLTRGSSKVRALSRLKSTPTTVVAGYTHPDFRDMSVMLIGTSQGNILELSIDSGAPDTYFKRDIKSLKTIWTYSKPRTAVTGLTILKDKIVALCGSQLLVWPFAPPITSFEEVLSGSPLEISLSHPEKSTSTQHLTVSPNGANVSVWNQNKLWSGTFPLKQNDLLQPLPINGVSYAILTRFHLVAVSGHELIFFNLLNNSIAMSLPLPKLDDTESFIGVCSDHRRNTYWIWTAQNLFELRINDEESAVWPVLVSQGRFEEALEVSNGHKPAREQVLQRYGESLISDQPVKAAKLLGLSNASIESAALHFTDNMEALAELFNARLSHTKSRSQQIILTSWLVEFYLSSGTEKSSENYRRLLDKYGNVISMQTVEEILEENGDSAKLIEFWTAERKFDKVVSLYISHEDWPKALETLLLYEDENTVYKYASLLLHRAPKATVESWMRIAKLDPRQLLPALTEYAVDYRGDQGKNQAARYLRHLLAHKSTADNDIYNALVMVYSVSPDSDESELLKFLHEKARAFNDQDFALRVCLQHNKIKSAVYLYTIMGLQEEAVTVCIENNLLDLAIENANEMSDNDSLKRHLLKQVAQKIISSQGPQAALKLLGLLKVDDLLGMFPDFDTLDDLAPEIVGSLERAKNKLASINEEMEKSLHSSQLMRQEIAQFKKQSVLVEVGEPCQICDFPLATRRFFVFPCQHGFHGDCLARVLESKKRGSAANDETLLKECYICSMERIAQIDTPLIAEF